MWPKIYLLGAAAKGEEVARLLSRLVRESVRFELPGFFANFQGADLQNFGIELF
jgi:hypothetical protein